jgi:lysophospholipase L1-like esterase
LSNKFTLEKPFIGVLFLFHFLNLLLHNYVDNSMLKTTISAAFIMLVLLACDKPQKSSPYQPVITPVTNPDTTLVNDTVIQRTYLALGDSYTIGQSVAENQRFPVQTVAMLNNVSVKFKQPEIIAQTGWTTGSLLFRLDGTPPTKSMYDIVTLLIGVNNQYQGRTQEEYRQQFTTLLERSIQYAGNNKKHVFVLSIPDYSVTPFAASSDQAFIARQIDSFNVINKTISDQYQVNYLDITGDTRLAATDPALIANDGLHPSGTAYAVWAGKLAPSIQALFP